MEEPAVFGTGTDRRAWLLSRQGFLSFVSLVSVVGSIFLLLSNAATATVTYSGRLSTKKPVSNYSVVPTANGALTAQTSVTKLTSETVSILDAAGTVLATQTATTGSVSVSISAAANTSYSVSISGQGQGNYTLTITYPTPDSPPPADTTPPTAPANLVSTAQATTSISLAWSASTDNVGVTAYNVYRDNAKVGTVSASSGSTTVPTSYTDSSLSTGTQYSYYVTASDAANNVSPASNSITATTAQAGDTSAPSAPGNLTSPSQTTTSVSLSWAASTDNVGVTAYDVYRNNVKVGSNASLSTAAPATSYTDASLTAGTQYSYFVKARDTAGNTSAASNTLAQSTQAADTVKPTVTITSPANGSTVAATVNISGSTSDNLALPSNSVSIQIDNGAVITPVYSNATATSVSYSYNWDTTLAINGSHTITVTTKDTAGNTATATSAVTVNNTLNNADTTKPTVTIANAGQNPVSGTSGLGPYGYAVDYDFTGVVKVECQVQGFTAVPITITSGTQANWQCAFDTTKYPDGTYYLNINAYDAAGNIGQAITQVTIRNTAANESKTYPNGLIININSIATNPLTGKVFTADDVYGVLSACGATAGDFTTVTKNALVDVQDVYGNQTQTNYTIYGDGTVNPTSFGSTMTLNFVGAATYDMFHSACHEYGHEWTLFYRVTAQHLPIDNLANYGNERWENSDGSIRIINDARYNLSYSWSPHEIIAEDYRVLLGDSRGVYTANGQYIRNFNTDIIDSSQQPDLKTWLLNTWR